MASKPLPTPDSQTGLRALKAMLQEGHPLAAMQVFHAALGDVFRLHVPGFTPVVMAGPQAARFVLVQARDELCWRNENDPVVDLLRHGVLVEDGDEHDALRRVLNPALHRKMLAGYTGEIWHCAAQVCTGWPAGEGAQKGAQVDMLVEMRKVALLSLMHTLCRVDFTPQLDRLWQAILGDIRYISPGLWMLWRGAPRPGYRRYREQLDAYLYALVAERRKQVDCSAPPPEDMLGLLVYSGMGDDLVRDQLLTMLIAGHDTVTALMAWTLYLLGKYPAAYEQARAEVDSAFDGDETPTIEQIGQLDYLGRVIREALRLYPPIHLGSRLAAKDLEYEGYHIPAGERVIYSIYLTQRHPAYWPDPDLFDPDRYAVSKPAEGGDRQPAYTWLAFGGGPRNCIGAAYGQMEAKIVLAYLLRHYDLELSGRKVKPHMGATLEPHPGVWMRVRSRK